MLQDIVSRYRHYWGVPRFFTLVVVSLACFSASMFFIFSAIGYANSRASNFVTDIVLSNIPALDVGWLFVYGTFIFFAFCVFATFRMPNRIPFTLLAFALFFFIRGIFISMTHLAPFPVEQTLDVATIFSRIFYGSDQFFSGHTGAPFLFALMHWAHPQLRAVFLLWSMFFGTIVLLGHLHYTIDVFAAFFITYAIYHLALWLLPKTHHLFLEDKQNF